MRFYFQKKSLLDIYEGKQSSKYSKQIVEALHRFCAVIKASKDERDLYALKSLHFEKLKGDRSDDRSLRLNDQYRLIVKLQDDDDGRYVLICEIEDYH